MQKQQLATAILSGLCLVQLSLTLPVLAASSPYWDNSANNGQTYYSPTQSSTQAPPSNPSYTQPSYSSGQYGSSYSSQSTGYVNPPPNQGYQQGYGSYQQPPAGGYGYQQSPPGGYGTGYGSSAQDPIRGYVATAPAGTTMNITTSMYLSSDTARIGDPVTATLGYDVASGGSVILPSGSQIQGEVASSIPAGRLANHGQLQLRFTRAVLPDGRQIPLSARLVTQDGTGIIKGGTTASRYGSAAKNTLGGAVIGGLGGTAISAISTHGKRPLQGLLWGSVIGAGAGLAKTAVDRGEEAKIQPGTQLQIMLDQPMSLSGASSGGGGYAPQGSYPSYGPNPNPY